jgi:ribose transport system ATP-binding protein
MKETPPPSTPPVLRMQSISKRFPGVLALDGVSLELRKAEVLGLMGENGAGKSTLMKILGGAYAPDGGQLLIDEIPVEFRHVKDAKRAGIALIHQELMLAPNLNIAGNIFLGNEPRKLGGIGWMDRGAMNSAASEFLGRVGLNFPPTTPVRALTAGQMQMVEIAKALSMNARIIIMDEPTSSLTQGETEKLYEIISVLRKAGISVIYISHRLDEVFRVTARIVVLRDGKNAGELITRQTNHDQIIAMMVGRALTNRFPERPPQSERAARLQVRDLVVPGAPRGVSFDAMPGEILGFAGLVGSGRTELMQTIFGVTRAFGGSMMLDGCPFSPRRSRDAIEQGVYLAPEDRKRHGLVLPMTVAQNLSLPSVGGYSPVGFLKRKVEQRIAHQEIERLRIKTPSPFQKAVNLSGGNQQKIVLGKWLAMNPKVLILDEPTRGIDVGAKAEIYQHMAKLAAQGITILMVSSDMEEIIGMSDRVAVMHERRINGILQRHELTQERIAGLMTRRVFRAHSVSA